MSVILYRKCLKKFSVKNIRFFFNAAENQAGKIQTICTYFFKKISFPLNARGNLKKIYCRSLPSFYTSSA